MPSDNRKFTKYLRAAVEHLEQAIEILSNPPPTADKETVEKALKTAAVLDPRYLEFRERQFKTGNAPGAVLAVIAHCLARKLPIPDWAATHFIAIYKQQSRGEFLSWNEAFGRPTTKGHALRLKRNADGVGKVATLVNAAKSSRQPIDNALFDSIGRSLGIGGRTLVKELYAAGRKKPTKNRRYSPPPS
jgi:hypothetical protein